MTDFKKIGKLTLEILERLPEPHIAMVATGIEAIVAAVHQAHVDADASGTPVTPEELQQQVTDAFAAAMEPWQRIQKRASAAELGACTGSTGE